jgi:type 1 glutamine amidotransferase/HEAT repeat protein
MLGCPAASAERVVFIIAENEYDAANTLPEFAAELEDMYGFSCEILQGADNSIPGMEALKKADLAVIYVRRQVLPAEQMKYLRDYVASGKPVVGIRTASHAFCLNEERPPAGFEEWPEFDRDVLGGNYHMHHGNKGEDGPFTYVWIKEDRKSHPILTGIPAGEFRVPSWLYKTSPLADSATVLMMGRVADRKPYEPVAWTNTDTAGGRVFYTSLGHPAEFRMRVFRTLLTNGIFWAMDKQVPSSDMIIDKLAEKIAGYDFDHSRRWLTFAEELVLQTQDQTKRDIMAGKLAALLESDTSFACKQWVCRQLSLVGTEKQVPAIAKMLTDEKLSDAARFALELIPSVKADESLRQALDKTSGKDRIGIINSIGKRRDSKAVKALGKLLSDSDRQSAEAAAGALAKVGDAWAVPLLAQKAATDAGKESKAARQSLSRLRRTDINRAIIELLDSGDAGVRLEAINSLAARKATEAAAKLLVAAEDKNAKIRAQSWKALAELAGQGDLPAMIALWVKIEGQSERKAAEDAVVAVARQVSAEDRSDQPILAVMDSVQDVDKKASLLSALGRIGDRNALPVLRESLKDKDSGITAAVIRALSSWPGDEPLEDLKQVVLSTKDAQHKVLAFRGFVRLIGIGDSPAAQKLKLYSEAMNLAERVDEKRLVLAGLGGVGHPYALGIVESYFTDNELRNEAHAAAVGIVETMDEEDEFEGNDNRDFALRVLKEVVGTSENESTIENAEELIDRLSE